MATMRHGCFGAFAPNKRIQREVSSVTHNKATQWYQRTQNAMLKKAWNTNDEDWTKKGLERGDQKGSQVVESNGR